MTGCAFPIRGPMVGGLALASVLLCAVAVLAGAPATAQDGGVVASRVQGQTRVHTAANIATLTFSRADVAHLVFAGGFADALAASYAAGIVDGPILLASRHGVAADSPTLHALAQLGVREVRLVGGPAVLSAAVEHDLQAHGYATARISGADRYATAAQVATLYGRGGGANVGTVEGRRTAVMASGTNFPDALAAGPIAAAAHLPLVLTRPHRADAATEEALAQLDIDHLLLLGGEAAVSTHVEQHYRTLGYDVQRLAGPDRTATAALLADVAVAQFGFSHDLTLLARGDDFPDALAASIYGATVGAPLLLTRSPGLLSQPTAGWLARNCPRVRMIRALGGAAAIQPGALDAAVTSAEACLSEA